MPRVLPMTSRLLAVLLLAVAPSAWAIGEPVYNGFLKVRRAGGIIDRDTGQGSLNVRRWGWTLTPDSDGIQPDVEPVIVAIGETERLVLPAGLVKASKNGRKFTYRDKEVRRGLRSLRIWRGKDPSLWQVKLQLVGIDLSRLTLEFPLCSPMAIIVGNDDGFSGVEFDRPDGFPGKRVSIVGFCDTGGAWPWL